MQLAISIFGGIIALVTMYLIFFRKSKTEKDVAAFAPYKVEVPVIVPTTVIEPVTEPVIEVVVKTRKPRKPKAATAAVKKSKKVKSTTAQP
jgi:BRCT domain type II-containing protein